MIFEEFDTPFNNWAAHASHFIGECYDLMTPYISNDSEKLPPLTRFVVAQLFIDCSLTSESALILIKNHKVWDADMLCRSVTEGSLKLVYILSTVNDEDSERKSKEYWYILPSFDSIRHHYKAEVVLKKADLDYKSRKPLEDMLLDKDYIEGIRKDWSKPQRNKLENQWSFTGMLDTFSKSDKEAQQLFEILSYDYGMSSHLLHKDGTGVGVVRDRYQREVPDQMAAVLSHAAKTVSGLCHLVRLRSTYILDYIQEDREQLEGLIESYDWLFEELKEAYDVFYRTEYAQE